jgi:FMN-dependent NADH-azoreductase
MKLLHIDSSILGGNSVSKEVSAAIVEHLRRCSPATEVSYHDLATNPLRHLAAEHIAAAQGAVPEAKDVVDDIAAGQTALQDFLAADVVVIGAAMYNFTIPSQLKSWIDRILVAGQTFRYTAEGPEGLAGAKRVIVAVARGSFYGPDSPYAAFEYVESYLKAVFGFIGVTKVEFVLADGIQMGPEYREKALESAKAAIAAL